MPKKRWNPDPAFYPRIQHHLYAYMRRHNIKSEAEAGRRLGYADAGGFYRRVHGGIGWQPQEIARFCELLNLMGEKHIELLRLSGFLTGRIDSTALQVSAARSGEQGDKDPPPVPPQVPTEHNEEGGKDPPAEVEQRSGPSVQDGLHGEAIGPTIPLRQLVPRLFALWFKRYYKNLLVVSAVLLLAFATYLYLSRLPIIIPSVADNSVKVDGYCDEYNGAFKRKFSDDAHDGFTYIQYDNKNLYICVEAQKGVFDGRNVAVFLNNLDDDRIFFELVKFTGMVTETWSLEKQIEGGWYHNDNYLAQFWDVKSITLQNREFTEYAISLEHFRLGICGGNFRLAVYHQWVDLFGTAYGWPIEKDSYIHPDVWQLAVLKNAPCEKGG